MCCSVRVGVIQVWGDVLMCCCVCVRLLQVWAEGLHLIRLPFKDDVRAPEVDPGQVGSEVSGPQAVGGTLLPLLSPLLCVIP